MKSMKDLILNKTFGAQKAVIKYNVINQEQHTPIPSESSTLRLTACKKKRWFFLIKS